MSEQGNSAYEDSGRRFRGPGGTSGGLTTFLFGLALSVVGAYLVMNQVQLTTGYWLWWGSYTFGFTLIPLIIGIGLLFFDSGSRAGWVLSVGGLLIIFAGIISSLHIYLRQTSLFDFLVMMTLFIGGLGLMARSLRGS